MVHRSSIGHVEDYVCPPDISIRDAMARITGKVSLFQVIVDGDRHILGTLTDGDIRRAILRGVSPDEPVHLCMNASPITGHVGDEAGNEKQTERIFEVAGEHSAFLPVTNSSGQLEDILIYEARPINRPSALIMAGGVGSRLGERTKNKPKPLLPIAGKPILDHIIERLESADVNTIYISVCYLAEQIDAFVSSRNNKAEIHLVHETKPLGTAGSVSLLPDTISERFLVLNGDVMTQVDFGALFSFHDRHEYDATIAVAQHRSEIPFGVVRHGEDGLFTGIDEKPTEEYFIAAGMYFLSPEFRSLAPPQEYLDMPTLLNKARKLGFKIGLFPVHEYWADIGRPDDFDRANGKYDQI